MYKFMHIEPEQFHAESRGVGMDVLCRICDEDVLCTEEECAEYLGRLWALFGEPDDPEGYEDFYSYAVTAESDGVKHYFLLQVGNQRDYNSVKSCYHTVRSLSAEQDSERDRRKHLTRLYKQRGIFAFLFFYRQKHFICFLNGYSSRAEASGYLVYDRNFSEVYPSFLYSLGNSKYFPSRIHKGKRKRRGEYVYFGLGCSARYKHSSHRVLCSVGLSSTSGNYHSRQKNRFNKYIIFVSSFHIFLI